MSYYLPQPPRAWSRVQSIPYCTDPIPSTNTNTNTVYVPITNENVSTSDADLQYKMLYKGNILQYKNNSSNLTKNQRYSQISKGMWVGNKSYGTQSITYTNPNTSSLYRVNYRTIPPNNIPGLPNNESGPYQTNIPNPFFCNSDDVIEGGSLICNTLAQPCTNEVIKIYPIQKCFPITASNVPGFSNPNNVTKFLCWDARINTWYPKTRLTMNNSGNKWPQNYKLFVSACKTYNDI